MGISEREPQNTPPFAHTAEDSDRITLPQNHWEPLFTANCPALTNGECESCESLAPAHGHLNKVAFHTAKNAAAMFPLGSDEAKAAHHWGYLTGLWHDLGKFAPQWQNYLAAKADLHSAEISGKLDHATAGAKHAIEVIPLLGHLIAYGIAGHHSGLLDTTSNGACQSLRLQKYGLPEIPRLPVGITQQPTPDLPAFLKPKLLDGFTPSFFSRMLFSSLVDADFIATEAFMCPSQTPYRNQPPTEILSSISDLVEAKIASFGSPSLEDTVNIQRAKVVTDCHAAAREDPGFFTLTVPTGGGKTLSSLSFALKHALAHGQQRIIYVVPFTSIIEQNADIIRSIVEPLRNDSFTPLIEHHSALSPERETTQSRLAAENWDAPIIITTAVQFYESLFAAKTSRSRKLHNIANSVVILDEAQTLPVTYLAPCLRALQELADHYHTTVVLCTATQPAIGYSENEFPIGLQKCREIIGDTASLFAALERVKIQALGEVDDSTLCERLTENDQVLCIVNRRKHAQDLYRGLGESADNFHLSALMCPEHRSEILNQIRARLDQGLPARVISTQLIEAGVDVDFPVVYRALAGLDSIAQAAGRCNRHGKIKTGTTYIFKPEDQKAETYFRETAQVADQLIDLYEDLLGEEAIANYFDLYYFRNKSRWDEKAILENFFTLRSDKSLPFRFQYSTTAKDFCLIESWQVPVIIPYDKKAEKLVGELRNSSIPLHRNLLRALQRYTVQIPPKLRDQNLRAFEALRDDQFYVLISPELNYSPQFGLVLNGEHAADQFLHC